MSDRAAAPTPPSEQTPNLGPTTDPNPGERSRTDELANVPRHSLGPRPASGQRAGGGVVIDMGAQVGIQRNLEFTAGGRSHRLSTGSFSLRRPTYDPKSGLINISTASDQVDSSVGRKAGSGSQPPMPDGRPGTGHDVDTSTGNTGPDRRRDRGDV